MKFRKYSEEDLKRSVKTSQSLRQVLTKLGIKEAGGNYRTLKKAISFLSLDTSHFTGRAWNKGKTFAPKRPLSDYLEKGVPIQSNRLRKRLLKEGTFNHVCSVCTRHTWMGNSIPLELDHINGDHEDNRLLNLRLLCPNCHAQTPTYRGKNIARSPSSGLPAVLPGKVSPN
jgi:hypothetical protein